MKKRILSTIVLWSLLMVTVVCFGVFGCFVILAIASALTQFELYKLLQLAGYKPMVKLGISCGIILQLLCFSERHTKSINLSDILVIAMIAVSVISLCQNFIKIIKNSLISTLIGVIYVPFLLSFPIAFAHHAQWFYHIPYTNSVCTIILMVAISKFSDVGGLLAGHKFGKTKIVPEISPNKSAEGLIGGVASSIITGILLFFLFNRHFIPNLTLSNVILLAVVLSVLAPMGDLIESALKRMANVKDSGNIIPEIGGMFDLTDSLILTLPAGTIFLKCIMPW